ncbi:DUF4256 domain-containing protein [Salegentibacter sp. F188]|uniref:DUF4256 domain-containing protein n=1 Tax=Autumnicola patrickiae TaxID=3075591 RepID=A0ABU3DYI6_9FLAO|nr:DUF4256 domain-containing protein [Salegentibacter sp. F188]MDT0688792.1 DUF4256 domain-containing protein [Salegentibacter sp. F188]
MALSAEEQEEGISVLHFSFNRNMHRHEGLNWSQIEKKLQGNNEKLNLLYQMEQSGGKPDVVGEDKKSGEYIFYDFSAESCDRRYDQVFMSYNGAESYYAARGFRGSLRV